MSLSSSITTCASTGRWSRVLRSPGIGRGSRYPEGNVARLGSDSSSSDRSCGRASARLQVERAAGHLGAGYQARGEGPIVISSIVRTERWVFGSNRRRLSIPLPGSSMRTGNSAVGGRRRRCRRGGRTPGHRYDRLDGVAHPGQVARERFDIRPPPACSLCNDSPASVGLSVRWAHREAAGDDDGGTPHPEALRAPGRRSRSVSGAGARRSYGRHVSLPGIRAPGWRRGARRPVLRRGARRGLPST